MNKKKTEGFRKLKLNKLVVRDLTPADLSNVEGGVDVNVNCRSCTCPPKQTIIEV